MVSGRLRELFLLLAFGASLGSGCTPKEPVSSINPAQARLPLPGKDDVLWVDGRTVSIEAFSALKKRFKNPSNDKAVWAASAALALQIQFSKDGLALPADEAVLLALYATGEVTSDQATGGGQTFLQRVHALPPAHELRSSLDALLSRTVIQKNLRLLAELQ